MAQWLAEGRITAREHIVEGFETFPETLQMLRDCGAFCCDAP